MNRKDFTENYYPIMFLTIVVCVSVVGLVLTNSITEERIEEARRRALNETLRELFADMDDFEYHDDIDVYFIYDRDDELIGYAFNTIADGYGGDIELIVALEDTDMTSDNIIVKGVSVLSHAETPGLGARIEESGFLKQFENTDIGDIMLTAQGGRIDAISGATESSEAVVDAVQEAAREKAGLIKDHISEGSA